MRTSARAVADYLASLFGHRPEPWHDKDAAAEPSDEPDVDFDASPHGLVATPSKGVEVIERAEVDAGAPIATTISSGTSSSFAQTFASSLRTSSPWTYSIAKYGLPPT